MGFTLKQCCQTHTVGYLQVHRKAWTGTDNTLGLAQVGRGILFSNPLAFRESLSSNFSQIMACLTPHHLLCYVCMCTWYKG